MKTTYLIALATLALGTFGCSSNTTVDSHGFEETGGSAGAGIGEAGNGGEIFVPGMGGTIEGTGGTIEGTGGNAQVGGSGSQTGGNDSTGGVESTGGTGPCVPKTCLTIAVELAGGQTDPVPDACGLVDDGCGNLIDCGGCADSTYGCGTGQFLWESFPAVDISNINKTPNLCQYSCVSGNSSVHELFCSNNEKAVYCGSGDPNNSQEPMEQQYSQCSPDNSLNEPNVWCCTL